MSDSTHEKFAELLDAPDYPNLTQQATDLAKRRGLDSLATLIRILLTSEIQKSADIAEVSKAGQHPDPPPTGNLGDALS